MKTILVVEDDPAVRNVVRFSLERAGYLVNTVPNARDALNATSNGLPDLVILDLILPDMNGIDLLQSWRQDSRSVRLPVIILTGRAEERDRIIGLRCGADDYVIKPFSRDELIARIETILKRVNPNDAADIIETNGIRLDSATVTVSIDSTPIPMGPLEFRLLRHFMSQPNRVHTRAAIIDHVWRSEEYVDPRSVDVQVRRLRRALHVTGHDHLIETVRGFGYRFSAR